MCVCQHVCVLGYVCVLGWCVCVCVRVYVSVRVAVCVEKETRELGSSSPKAICRQNFLLLGEVSLGASQAFN